VLEMHKWAYSVCSVTGLLATRLASKHKHYGSHCRSLWLVAAERVLIYRQFWMLSGRPLSVRRRRKRDKEKPEARDETTKKVNAVALTVLTRLPNIELVGCPQQSLRSPWQKQKRKPKVPQSKITKRPVQPATV